MVGTDEIDRIADQRTRLLASRAGHWVGVRSATTARHLVRQVLPLHHGVFLHTLCGRFFSAAAVAAGSDAPACCACQHLRANTRDPATGCTSS